jgi:SAM-dependent methyltransferase
MLRPEILDFYERGGERDRLAVGAGRLEYLRTWDVLTRMLPSPAARVLDVGGATGVYAGPLAHAGYEVHVVDPVLTHVAAAGALPGVSSVLGDARALPFASGTVDAVLLFGPLYHLQERTDRVVAWREAARVLRPGGVVIAATISRFASLFDGFVKGYFADHRFRPLVDRALVNGVHHNLDPSRTWFTTAYFHHPDELVGELADAGLVAERRIAVESPLWMAEVRLDSILADLDLLLDMLRRVEEEPSLLGASSHMLTVARCPDAA